MVRNRGGGTGGHVKKIAISAGLVFLGVICLLIGLKWQIGQIIDAVSKLKARGVVGQIINETVSEEFSAEDYGDSLFKVEKGSDGRIQSVQSGSITEP